jgi:hypothetical protein
LENDHWEDLKANRKLEIDLRGMAFDVDNSSSAETMSFSTEFITQLILL